MENDKKEVQSEIIIYQTEDGNTKIDVKLEDETVWLTQAQLCELYQTSKSNISEHIKHIFEEGELEENSVVRKFRTTGVDGKNYNITHYNLDMIISLGYREGNIGTKMENSYRFFENRECEYFPCHKGLKDFNCLFCYCPLYTKLHCPGNPTYIEKNGIKIKVCADCTFPHRYENYDVVLRILKEN